MLSQARREGALFLAAFIACIPAANWLIGALTGTRIHDNGCTLKAYRLDVVRKARLYAEMHRFLAPLLGLSGCRYKEVVVNHRARRLAIEIAWLWLRHQPESELTRWYRARVGNLEGKLKRITLVALARKLMIALWRYLETGVVPKGAALHPSL